ncbi:MAG: hypothetical protein K2K84_10265 [Muribaculaceae bacterium]|nr:hypothetical protein [Muribaculaceae bacterium]
MATAARINTRRKLIDIPEDVFQTLNLKAAAMGTNLKKFIEELLIRESEDMDDAEVYKYLVATRPEGKVMLNSEEKKDFEDWLNQHRK